MKSPLLSQGTVKQSLSAHSWIGLLVGVLMYLVCLSGTLAVFYNEFERWEQANISESLEYNPSQIQRAYEEALARTEETHHIYISLPKADLPRATVSTDHGGWFINGDGSLGEEVRHDWTHLLINLHLYLHLPSSFGMILVSLLGALLCALIVSGFLSHPRIFKDAFCLRLKGSRHLEQADIHNRLSVWGAPFHLMIAITGAFFGLVFLMSLLYAALWYGGDEDAVIAEIYGPEPQLQQNIETARLDHILESLPSIAPDAEEFFITLEDVNEPAQYVIVSGSHEGRLIWAEQYRFDNAGNYLGKVGFSDGAVGSQAIFSIYRLHFGHFGGFAVKVIYALFGLALTVVSVSGINIWLAKRKNRDSLNNLWLGIVWGAPAALTLSAITQVVVGIPSVAVLWLALVASMVTAQVLNNDARSKFYFYSANGGLLLILVLGHALRFGEAAISGIGLGVNLVLLCLALIFGALAFKRRDRAKKRLASRSSERSLALSGE